jgi:hypothetical protein
MKRLTTIMAAAVTAATLAAPAIAQDQNSLTLTGDFGRTTGSFTTQGFTNAGGASMTASSVATYDGLEECLSDAAAHHDALSQHQLFSDFDIATRVVCKGALWDATVTEHYGSPIAISRLKNNLGS